MKKTKKALSLLKHMRLLDKKLHRCKTMAEFAMLLDLKFDLVVAYINERKGESN